MIQAVWENYILFLKEVEHKQMEECFVLMNSKDGLHYPFLNIIHIQRNTIKISMHIQEHKRNTTKICMELQKFLHRQCNLTKRI